jgi:hypothetical protein
VNGVFWLVEILPDWSGENGRTLNDSESVFGWKMVLLLAEIGLQSSSF